MLLRFEARGRLSTEGCHRLLQGGAVPSLTPRQGSTCE